jgi:cyclopropane-fatty-acyl-phospholipid synthase
MSNIIYSVLLVLVSAYKTFEKGFMRLFRNRIESIVKYKFGKAGITVNGSNAWDVKLHNKEFYTRVACDSTLGMGEAYMEGWWDCEDVQEFSYRVFMSGIYKSYMSRMNRLLNYLLLQCFNLQTKARAFEVGLKHYDQGKSSTRMLAEVKSIEDTISVVI